MISEHNIYLVIIKLPFKTNSLGKGGGAMNIYQKVLLLLYPADGVASRLRPL